MSWTNFKGAVAQHIPGTTTNRINKLNRLSKNPESLSSIEQGRIATGHMLGRVTGGAIIGGVGNAAIYSDQQRDLGGSYSMGEAFLGGAAAGAFGGAVVGALGAKTAVKNAAGNIEKSNKQIGLLTDKLTNNQGSRYRQFKTSARSAKKKFTKNEANNPGTTDGINRGIFKNDTEIRKKIGAQISAQINSYKDFNSSASLSNEAKQKMRTHIFSKPIDG